MPTKTSVEKKKSQARDLLKQNPKLTAGEIYNLTGLSKSSAQRVKQSFTQGTLNGSKPQANIPISSDAPQEPEEKTTIDFEDSPAPVEKKGVVDSALSSLKGMLGIADKKDSEKSNVVFSTKLDARRQQFVDSATPTLSLAFMALASYLWGRVGPEYSQLAPDEKVAQRIVEPLLRVYARHANFMTDINPDVADVGASMFALVAYVHASLGLYQQIKAEKDEYEQQNGEPYRRDYRQQSPAENGSGNASNGYADVRGRGGSNGSANGVNGRGPQSVGSTYSSDKESRQHEALLRLSELDYLARSRRSGRA